YEREETRGKKKQKWFMETLVKIDNLCRSWLEDKTHVAEQSHSDPTKKDKALARAAALRNLINRVDAEHRNLATQLDTPPVGEPPSGKRPKGNVDLEQQIREVAQDA